MIAVICGLFVFYTGVVFCTIFTWIGFRLDMKDEYKDVPDTLKNTLTLIVASTLVVVDAFCAYAFFILINILHGGGIL